MRLGLVLQGARCVRGGTRTPDHLFWSLTQPGSRVGWCRLRAG